MYTDPIPHALGSEEGEAFWGFGSLITIKASAEQTGERFSLVELLTPGGVATPLHVHREDDETFYVVEGELTFYLGEAGPRRTSAGSLAYVPGGVVHAYRVDSETARYLIVTTPQHERFLRAAFGDPAPSRTLPPEGPLDMERIMAAAQEYGVEILGPPPGMKD